MKILISFAPINWLFRRLLVPTVTGFIGTMVIGTLLYGSYFERNGYEYLFLIALTVGAIPVMQSTTKGKNEIFFVAIKDGQAHIKYSEYHRIKEFREELSTLKVSNGINPWLRNGRYIVITTGVGETVKQYISSRWTELNLDKLFKALSPDD